jgi:hypothetical protein
MMITEPGQIGAFTIVTVRSGDKRVINFARPGLGKALLGRLFAILANEELFDVPVMVRLAKAS